MLFLWWGVLALLLWEAEYGLMLLIADILTLFLPPPLHPTQPKPKDMTLIDYGRPWQAAACP